LLAAFVFLPNGEKGTMLLISFLALLAAFLFSLRVSSLLRTCFLIFMAAEIILFFLAPSWLSFRISPFKALPIALEYPQAKHIFTNWNSISRIDILESPAVRYAPGLSLVYGKKLPPQLGLSVDGGELTAVTQFNKEKDSSLEFLTFLPSSFAYHLLQKPSALIIEPKGGLDVLAAFFFKASRIKAIESNPLITKLLDQELAPFSGSIYQKENIHYVLAKSRAALKQEKESYDLIVLSLTDVFGSSSTGAYGFRENYLYTLESFVYLLNRLSSQGIVSITFYLLPPPRQEIRLLATWVEALEKITKNPSSHIMVIRSWGTISYFIKKNPYKEQDIKKLKAFTKERLFDLVYYPGIKAEETNIHNEFDKPLYYNLTLQLLSPCKRKNLYKNYLFQLKPATDNRPFFFNFFKLSKLKATYKALGRKWLPLLQGGFLVPVLLIQSVIMAFLFIFFPLLLLKKSNRIKRGLFLKVFLYFSLIGAAFIFVEITWIQKFILFLGHPLYSISTIIFSLLLSSGLGSLFSKKFLGQNLRNKAQRSLFLCSSLIFIYLFILPLFYENLIGLNLSIKIILTFLIIFPLGFFMGFPFPTGIRLLDLEEKNLIPWAWAINAFSSVVNSILALMLAFWGGYNLVLLLAAAGYLLAFPFINFSKQN